MCTPTNLDLDLWIKKRPPARAGTPGNILNFEFQDFETLRSNFKTPDL